MRRNIKELSDVMAMFSTLLGRGLGYKGISQK